MILAQVGKFLHLTVSACGMSFHSLHSRNENAELIFRI